MIEMNPEWMVGPWGSWKNFAADQLGAWEWFGERDSAGHPCRYRMTYRCDKCVVARDPGEMIDGPLTWRLDWSCCVDDDCSCCGRTYSPVEAVDLLDDPEVCPINMVDD